MPAFASQPTFSFLCRVPELLPIPLSPPADLLKPAPSQPEARPIVRAWNRFGGLLAPACEMLGIDLGCALAVLCVESGGSGFGPDGRLKIRFEVHHFRRALAALGSPLLEAFPRHFCFEASRAWLGHMFRNGASSLWQHVHRSQSGEWEALHFARCWHEPAALASTSMGAPQILGANHAAIGYGTAREMFDAFADPQRGERNQLLAFFDFLRRAQPQEKILAALHARNFTEFARLYNGPGQAAAYAQRIATQFELWQKV